MLVPVLILQREMGLRTLQLPQSTQGETTAVSAHVAAAGDAACANGIVAVMFVMVVMVVIFVAIPRFVCAF